MSDKTKEIADLISGMVLDNMAIAMTRETGIYTSRSDIKRVLESGDFPELVQHYNEQVNGVCDNLVTKS